ncbi:MAG: O-antigen ligase family protein, partial [Candidatus Binatia bacterium]|nr:O-antigen ligase family protein [Candidatus Binatia bacterium]
LALHQYHPGAVSKRPLTQVAKNNLRSPPAFVEYAYYVILTYSITATAWGVAVNMLGAASLAVLAAYCAMQMRPLTILRLIAFPLGCAASFLLVQLLVHDEGLLRAYVTWIFGLIIIQSLCFRKGFLHRFAWATFVIGLMLLPYLNLEAVHSGDVGRAGLEGRVGYGNSNDLAAWFGFCAVYFFIFGMLSKDLVKTVVSWTVAALCLGVVGLTVSRGGLLAVAMAVTVALRGKLKGAFVPLMMLMFMGWVAFEAGVFEGIVSSYSERAFEESGRLVVWPAVVERFLNAPLFGVGESNVDTWAPGANNPTSPHNGFLYVGLAGGIFPLVFFCCYWFKASSALFHPTQRSTERPFVGPLLVYTFIVVSLSNTPFMFPLAMVTLSTAVWMASQDKQLPRTVSRKVRNRCSHIRRRMTTVETQI